VAPAPDETSVCRFRHLLEKHELGGAMLDAVNHHLDSKGIRITTGTMVDATIIHAPSSTKNSTGERDPEMHQTRKGKQWCFGLKAHRCRQQRGRGAFGVHLGGQRGGRAYVTRLIARRRAQGMGQRRLSGADRSDPPGRAPRPGYDLPQDQVQELRG
jgi:IS5 family transposase